MKLIDAREQLSKLNLPVLTLQDVIGVFQLEKSHASHIMNRLTQAGSLIKIKRGLWAWPESDPFPIATYLTIPFPNYISLQTALFYHGMIEQVPAYCYVITLGRKQKISTTVGTFSIHHVNVNFFTGFETHYNPYYQIASPEKAILDYFYLGRVEPSLFGVLPELDTSKINIKKLKKMVSPIEHTGIRTYLTAKINDMLN